VIHRTFRSLDDAPKLVGFTIKQWATLILGAGSVLGLIHLGPPAREPAPRERGPVERVVEFLP